jgi:hypothetical protein
MRQRRINQPDYRLVQTNLVTGRKRGNLIKPGMPIKRVKRHNLMRQLVRRIPDFLIKLKQAVIVVVVPRIHAKYAQTDKLQCCIPHISNLLYSCRQQTPCLNLITATNRQTSLTQSLE